MASPLEHFRKNQRFYMAILVVVSLIAFVLVPGTGSLQEIQQVLSGQSGSRSLVSWKGGNLTANELNRMQQTQVTTYNVLEKVEKEVLKAGGVPRVPGYSPDPNNPNRLGIQRLRMDQSQEQVMESVTDLFLLSDIGRQHGIVVDDKTVDQFIRQFTDGKISGKRFEEITREIAGPSLTRFDMYAYLRAEITRQLMVQMGFAGMTAPSSVQPLTTPAKGWSNFQKLQQRTKIEAFPVFVDDMLAKVTATPSEQELRLIYERGKNLFAPPKSVEPGFQEGYKTNLEYIVLNADFFQKQEEAAITDEVLKAEYDKRVIDQGMYRVPVETPAPADKTTPETESKATDPKPADSTPANNNPPKIEAANDKPAETPAAEATETAKPNEPASPSDAKPETPAADSKPESASEPPSSADAKPANDPAASSDAKDPGKDQSSSISVTHRSGRLVAFQAEPSTETSATTQPVDAPKDPAPVQSDDALKLADDVKPNDAKPESAKDTTEAQSKTTPSEASATNANANPASDSASTKTNESIPLATETTQPPASEKPMRTRTFDEVKEELRREMAQRPAAEKRDAAAQKIREAMDKYHSDLEFYKTGDKNDKDNVKPEMPSLSKLADENGFGYGKTGMVDAFAVQEISIGRSFIGLGLQRPMGIPDLVFNPRIGLFLPIESQGFDGNQFTRFLFWKIEDAPQRVPAFEEVREKVLNAWKTSQARIFAMEKAQQIATQLNATNDPDPWPAVLEESVRNLVIRPPTFTWYQPSFSPGEAPMLGTVEGIPDAGSVFLERVCSGKVGSTVVSFDELQQKCFVIRIIERTPTVEELQNQFLSSPRTGAAESLAQQDTQMTAAGWFRNIANEVGLNANMTDE